MSSESRPVICTFGEVLWDCLPEGLFLGGAPFNVAFHAACLGAEALPVSTVGRDFLGEQVLVRARRARMDTRLIKRHETLPTGVAVAELDEKGNASYSIEFPAAWDEIRLAESELAMIGGADAFIYGTLAARSDSNLRVIEGLLQAFSGLKICDVNLRAPYDSIDRARSLASRADVVKLNEEELHRLIDRQSEGKVGEATVRACAELLGVETILVTLGGAGAMAFNDDRLIHLESKPIEVVDTVGAGDAFTAAFAYSRLGGESLEDSLRAALDLGAFVAGRRGAQPGHGSIPSVSLR